MHSGRRAGLLCAFAHGVGVGLYGLLTVAGLAVVIARSGEVFTAIQLLGAAYLVFLGFRSLKLAGERRETPGDSRPQQNSAALDGFLIAFLNPKLAVFMLALFSQFLDGEAGCLEKATMVMTVGITDASWYMLVTTLVTQERFLARLNKSAATIDRLFGVLLLLLAGTLIVRTFA